MIKNKTVAFYTFSMGRWHYLEKAIDSVLKARQNYLGLSRHLICLQGVAAPDFLKKYGDQIQVIEWQSNVGIAEGINQVSRLLSEELIIKLDDDCEIVSNNFLTHVNEISNLYPNLIFSPFPVGLIGNLGGVQSQDRKVIYSETLDTYYTLRFVPHVGGFCRISPRFTLNWHFQNDLGIPGASGNEDVQFSNFVMQNNLKLAYLENALIVEHQESTLGQHARYGKNYFGDRF